MTGADAVFEKVLTDRVAAAAVDQVEGLIVAGVLRPGGKLPGERELAERLDISRPKLREALEILRARGLIETRPGDGAYVADLIGAALAPPMVELLGRRPEALRDFLEYRRETDGYAARLAATRAAASDHAAIRDVLARMEAAHAARAPDREARLDLEFHMTIVEAAHNAILLHVTRSIYDLVAQGVLYNRGAFYDREPARRALLDQHRAIAGAVLSGDGAGAAAAAAAHIDHVARTLAITEDAERREDLAARRSRARGA